MKENKMEGKANEQSEHMRALYDRTPYPAALQDDRPKGNPLLEHWINSALGYKHKALQTDSNILVAGCGSGEEAIMLAEHYPSATVVGIDFSEVSIERARAVKNHSKLHNVAFEVADLTEASCFDPYPPFDFVLCHGVADYVLDFQAFLKGISACLADKGILYLTVNSIHHPAKRIQRAFANLEVPMEGFMESSASRQLLKVVDKLIGANSSIKELGEASGDYLAVDIFPPIAHHLSFDQWCDHALEMNLHFCGSLEALDGLRKLGDGELSMFYKLGRPALSSWMIRLSEQPGMQMLFSRTKPVVPHFDDLTSFMKWRPKLDTCVGNLPHLSGDPHQAMNLTLRFPGLPDFLIYSTAFDLEVMRNCDGLRSIADILEEITVEGDQERLRSCLFRAYHYGLLAG